MIEPARKVAPAGAVGNLVPSVLYAVTGAVAAAAVSGSVVFCAVLLVAAAFWLVGWVAKSGTRAGAGAAGIGASLRKEKP